VQYITLTIARFTVFVWPLGRNSGLGIVILAYASSSICPMFQDQNFHLGVMLHAIDGFVRSTDRAALAMDLSAAQQSIDHAKIDR